MSTTTPTILQVLPRLQSGGVERGTIEMTEAIRLSAMKPLVASAGGALVPHISHAGGEHITLPLASKNPFTMHANIGRLAQLIRQREVDLIHARSRAPAWSAYYAAKRAGIPFLATWHGIYGTEGLFKKRYNEVMLKGELTIAVSKFVFDHIVREYGADPSRLRLIPRGVDSRVFSAEKANPGRIAQLTKSWMLPDEPVPVLLCPGRINRNKGHEVLIDALAELSDMRFLCMIVGSDHGMRISVNRWRRRSSPPASKARCASATRRRS
ncbi:MAG: glycosyltransferase [Alphaproteobacteria bacterium]